MLKVSQDIDDLSGKGGFGAPGMGGGMLGHANTTMASNAFNPFSNNLMGCSGYPPPPPLPGMFGAHPHLNMLMSNS